MFSGALVFMLGAIFSLSLNASTRRLLLKDRGDRTAPVALLEMAVLLLPELLLLSPTLATLAFTGEKGLTGFGDVALTLMVAKGEGGAAAWDALPAAGGLEAAAGDTGELGVVVLADFDSIREEIFLEAKGFTMPPLLGKDGAAGGATSWPVFPVSELSDAISADVEKTVADLKALDFTPLQVVDTDDAVTDFPIP
eukprot:TRINITY_DN4859_c0_g1_i1.p2 TRINITY_DN4859_c0_g1~~TRINITY_DN4859_c0_g1_i1.p2  ORF type:complete len:196 (+),score=39.19 TRINITY_DN4859_c0_g1_i1:343-930(+)